jgi:LuxR family quorum-sensing system transcriptional regulator SolR
MYHGRFPQTRAGNNDIYFDNCPEDWRAYYRARDAEGDDGLLRLRGTHEVTPLLWRQLVMQAPTLFAEARKFGLVTGSSHPVHAPGGQWSALSFIKDHGGVRAEVAIRATLARCQLIAGYVHEATVRIVTQRLDAPIPVLQPRPARGRLNERERQVLMWVSVGKTTAEIADALCISSRTVVFHLSNVRQKLGASNSRQAISKALALGLIQVQYEDPRVQSVSVAWPESRPQLAKSGTGSSSAGS